VPVTKIYFMITAEDMDRAVAFYRDVIGLGIRMSSPGWSELTHGDATVALHKGGGGDAETGLGFDVDDIEVMCSKVRLGGGAVVREPQDRPGGEVRLAGVHDTEGNGFFLSQTMVAHD
jgi:predicted enzyme related to lactoylglutathione lyase